MRALLGCWLVVGLASATPRFAAAKGGPPICACRPRLARTLPVGEGRAVVFAATDGPLTLVGAPGAGPSPRIELGDASLRPAALVPVDADLDGAVDLFVPSALAGAPHALFASRAGGFVDEAASRLPKLAGGARAATWGDVDGDGAPDLVVVREASIELLMNDGAGVFTSAPPERLPTVDDQTPKGDGVFDALAIDVDQDLDLDLVVLRAHGLGRVLLNDGAGSFSERAGGLPARGATSTVAVDFADLDASGSLDLLLTGGPLAGGAPVSALLGPELLVGRPIVDAPGEDLALRTIDATGDGALDAIALSRTGPRLLVGAPSGLRVEADAIPPWGGGPRPAALDVGDFDGDGLPDLLGAREDGTSFFYRALPPAPGAKRPPRALRIGGVTRQAAGEPIALALALRDVTRPTSERPFARIEVEASVAGATVTPLFARHVGGDLVRIELPAASAGETVRVLVRLPDGRGDPLVVGPLELAIGAEPPPADQPAPPAAAPPAPPAPSPPSAWSCGVGRADRGSVGLALIAVALGAGARRRRAGRLQPHEAAGREREVHEHEHDEHHRRGDEVRAPGVLVARRPAVGVELPARAPAQLRLHAAQQILLRRGRGHGARASQELAHAVGAGGRVGIVFESLFVAHGSFSPRQRSTHAFSCARARNMRLLTVPSGRPVTSAISSYDRSSTSRRTSTSRKSGSSDAMHRCTTASTSCPTNASSGRATSDAVTPRASASERCPSSSVTSSCSLWWRRELYLARFFVRLTAMRKIQVDSFESPRN
ncbi:MAG: VCBS repeat-containing protein [Polyangiaceae bacterium]|nr:VCBS repeat-containing protein [Polyangiaceae bacterium]